MKKPILYFLLLLVCIPRLNAQIAPSIEWQKSLGGSDDDGVDPVYEMISGYIQQTIGGFIVAGMTTSDDGDIIDPLAQDDYWIVKLDSLGNIEVAKCLGGPWDDDPYCIQSTTDGGFIVAGYTRSYDGDVSFNHGGGWMTPDYWIVKLDSNADIQWEKSLGGGFDDNASFIQQTNDGGYIVSGMSESNNGDVPVNHGGTDAWIVKLDSSGTIQWQKSLGGSYDDDLYSVQQTIDGGYVMAGFTNSNDVDVSGNHGEADFWIVKLDSSGNIQWQKCLGGSADEKAYSIRQTTDSGFIVAGYSWSNDGDVSGSHGLWDYWIVKLDSSANIQWQKCLGGSDREVAFSIQQTTDGAYVVAGGASSNDGDVSGNHGNQYYYGDYWIVKLDTAGNLVWQKCLGGSAEDKAYSIQQTNDGGFIVAGSGNSYDGDVSGHYVGSYDLWVVKLSPEIPLSISSATNSKMFSIYPNPTNSNITITATFTTPQSLLIKLTDIVGREVLSFDEGRVSGNFAAHYDLSTLSSGTYFLKMIHDGTSEVKKVEIEQ